MWTQHNSHPHETCAWLAPWSMGILCGMVESGQVRIDTENIKVAAMWPTPSCRKLLMWVTRKIWRWIWLSRSGDIGWRDQKSVSSCEQIIMILPTSKRLNYRPVVFFGHFNFTITYNIKPDALSREFALKESPSGSDNILSTPARTTSYRRLVIVGLTTAWTLSAGSLFLMGWPQYFYGPVLQVRPFHWPSQASFSLQDHGFLDESCLPPSCIFVGHCLRPWPSVHLGSLQVVLPCPWSYSQPVASFPPTDWRTDWESQ